MANVKSTNDRQQKQQQRQNGDRHDTDHKTP